MQSPILLPFSLSVCALLVTPSLAQQRYSTGSFEAPEFSLGTLPGPDLFSGQDGWILLGGSPASAQIQSNIVRSGSQAVTWDAAALGAGGGFGELRRNALFSHAQDEVLEITFDFMIEASAQPTEAWIVITQYAPIPCSEQFRWLVKGDGEVWIRQGTNCASGTTFSHTGVFLPKDTWLHARTVVDATNDLVELWIDGVPIAQSNVTAFAPLPEHGFTQIFCDIPGDDRMHLDNFLVRSRPHDALALTVDLERVDSAGRVVTEFRMHAEASRAFQPYLLLASTSGSSPGTAIGGGLTLPLNADGLTTAMLSALPTQIFAGFQSVFDANGYATATFDSQIPLPVLLGTTMHFAYVPFFPMDAVSEAVVVEWQ